ncbi:hypothetical protein BASA81_007378 [Batrachochytrium salamandrivorans]|nr:hypothetical protein BASA81_007378 [Batrachochytrium salamandrivorans]
MSNPFAALDLSDDENITVVKPVAAPAQTKPATGSAAPGKPRKELQKEEAALQQKKKSGARNNRPQPDVAHPGERSKIGLAKEEHVKTNKRVDAAGTDARGARTFDRHSGTGRGREVRKAGAGARNWGKPGDEAAAVAKEGESAAAEEPVVEEEPQFTLADFEAQKLAKRSGAAFAEKQVRKVAAADNLTVLKKEEDANYIKLGAESAAKKPQAKETKKKVFEAEFNFAREPEQSSRPFNADRPPRRDAGARPPRDGARAPRAEAGAPRPARVNQAPIDTADQSAFPKLGA